VVLVQLVNEAKADEGSCSQIAEQLSAAGARTVLRPFHFGESIQARR
jgi:hypothetical protein